jgi:hypothetical protein
VTGTGTQPASADQAGAPLPRTVRRGDRSDGREARRRRRPTGFSGGALLIARTVSCTSNSDIPDSRTRSSSVSSPGMSNSNHDLVGVGIVRWDEVQATVRERALGEFGSRKNTQAAVASIEHVRCTSKRGCAARVDRGYGGEVDNDA